MNNPRRKVGPVGVGTELVEPIVELAVELIVELTVELRKR